MLAIMTHSFVVVVLCKLVGNTSEGFPGLHDTRCVAKALQVLFQ